MRALDKIWVIFTLIIIFSLILPPSAPANLAHWVEEDNPLPLVDQTHSLRVSKPVGNGPYSTQFITVGIPRVNNNDVPARIYYPSVGTGAVNPAGAPYPGLVWAPGAGGYETSYSSTLSSIASWGFIITIVGTGGPCNQEVVDIQSYVIDYYEALNSNSSSIFYNKISSTGYGASGHSNGGWAAIAGGVADNRYKAICTIMGAASPYYDNGQANAANLHIPLQLVAGSQDTTYIPSSNAYYAVANPIKSYIILQGSSHGGPFHLEYLVSFYKYWLAGEKDYGTFIYGDDIFKDVSEGLVQFQYNVGLTAVPTAAKTSVKEDEEVELTGEGVISEPSGPNREIVLYEWDTNNDGTYDDNYTTPPTKYTMTFFSKGDYEVVLRVTDSWGMMAKGYIAFTVSNVRPTALTGKDQSSQEDALVHFDASASFDTPSDQATLQYKWDFGDKNSTDWQDSTTASHVFTQEENYTIRLFVRDDDGEIDSDISLVSVKNVPPTAVISDYNKILEVDELLVLNASQSTDTPSDLNTLSYYWFFSDSESAQGQEVSRTFDDEGDYTITLTVIDDDGAESSVTVKVIVDNSPPSCTVMDDVEVDEDEIIILIGAGSDTSSDLDKLRYSWDLGVPGVPVTPWSTSAEFQYQYENEGEYQAVLTVKDDNGVSATAAVTIWVKNIAPTAKFSVSSTEVNEDEIIEFDASSSSDTPSDLPNLNYTWDFDDNSKTSYGKIVTHSYSITDDYVVELTVRDDNGLLETYNRKIQVNNVKPIPEIIASADYILLGGEIIFDARHTIDTPSDLEGLTYSWDFDDKTTASGTTVVHTFELAGGYTVKLTVTDDDGAQNTAELTIKVTDLGTGTAKNVDTTGTDSDDNKSELNNIVLAEALVGAFILVFLILLLFFILISKKQKNLESETSENEEFREIDRWRN